ncbi:MAG: hypothetical protein HYU97_06495 [Deltaproteobacteria bacterium]|nr:hypothetical protein [Deltaproteobacteria bacterium]
MVSPINHSQDPQLAQALRLRGAELLRFGNEQQKGVGASLLQWVEEQGGYEGALAASELCKGGAESKHGCSSVERVMGGATQVMQNLDFEHVALLAGVGLLGQVTRNGVMGWMGRRVESWWNRGRPATILAKGAGVTTEVMGITGIGVAHKVKAGQPVNVGEEFFHTGIGWLGLRLGMEGLGVVPKALHQWGRYEVPRLAGAMTFSRVTSAFVGGTVGMVAVGQDVYQATTTQAQFMVGMRGVHEFIPAYGRAATKLHNQGRFLAAKLDLTKYPKLLKSFQWPNFPSAGMKPLLAGANSEGSRASLSVKLPEADKGGFRSYSTGVPGSVRNMPISDRQIHQTLDYVNTLPPFNVRRGVSKRSPVEGGQGAEAAVPLSDSDLTGSIPHFKIDIKNPNEFFRSIGEAIREKGDLFNNTLGIYEQNWPIGYLKFSIVTGSNVYQLAFMDAFIDPTVRGRGIYRLISSYLVGATLYEAARFEKPLEVIHHQVRNFDLRQWYMEARMEEFPIVDETEALAESFSPSYGGMSLTNDGRFISAPVIPSFRVTHDSHPLKVQLDPYKRADKVLRYVKTLPPFNIEPTGLPRRPSYCRQSEHQDLDRKLSYMGASYYPFYFDPQDPTPTFFALLTWLDHNPSGGQGMVIPRRPSSMLRGGLIPLGYRSFEVRSTPADYALTYFDVYVHQASRGQGLRDAMDANLLGALLYKAASEGKGVTVTYWNVGNPLNKMRYKAAGLEEVSPEVFGSDIEGLFTTHFRIQHAGHLLKQFLQDSEQSQ